MKLIKIYQVAALFSLVVFAACSPGRHYISDAPPPPGYGSTFSLIVNPYPGIVVSRYYDGHYYYRNPQGYTYWRGSDNRYYLDRTYVGRNYRNHREYQEWKNYGRGYNNGRRRRH